MQFPLPQADAFANLRLTYCKESHHMRFALTLAIALTAATLAGPIAAQERPQAILVLDASGSMWGQIEGVAKITIAQGVIAGLLDTLPQDQNLGLVAYGHRVRGNCADIETLVAPGPDTRAAIRSAVIAISPRGKTPMTDAVIAAAEALRYTEEKATVILVSDGIETCNPDPCAAARLLEEAGIDFTAHVVGFDVAGNPEALAQMQCLAGETGGTFLTADNADELAAALIAVAATPEPEPESEPEPAPLPVEITFLGTIGKGGAEITSDLIWEVTGGDLAPGDPKVAPKIAEGLLPGMYHVAATRPEDELTVEADFEAYTQGQTIILIFPEIIAKASVSGPVSAPLGAMVEIGWTGPGAPRDYISVAEPGQSATQYVNYTYLEAGNPLKLQMPPKPGAYVLRYIETASSRALVDVPIEITEVATSIEAPAEAAAGAVVQIGWTGPGYGRDYIAVAKPGDPDSTYINYTYTEAGAPLGLQMPPEPGAYELRYVLSQDNTVLARQAISVADISVTLQVPAKAAVGATVQIGWTGPDYPRDYISVAKPGDSDGTYVNYTYTTDGANLGLQMPPEPGAYEIRYVLSQDNKVLLRQPVTVTAVEASVQGPAEAPAGALVQIGWTGPDYPRDYISVARVGDSGGTYVNYTYTEAGTPLGLKMPAAPGDYEVRYVLSQNNTVLALQPITVTSVTAALDAPPSAPAGGEVSVIWKGPGYPRDYIAVSRPGDSGYQSYTYVEGGSPLVVALPEAPGTYELRYVMDQGSTVIATRPLIVK